MELGSRGCSVVAGSVLGPGVAVGEGVRAGVKEGAAMTSMPGLALGLGVGPGAGEPQAARPRQQRAVIPARTRRAMRWTRGVDAVFFKSLSFHFRENGSHTSSFKNSIT